MMPQIQVLADNLKDHLNKKEQELNSPKAPDAHILSCLNERMKEIYDFETGAEKFSTITSSIEKKTIIESFTKRADEIMKEIDEIA